jgi:hypothetical protein
MLAATAITALSASGASAQLVFDGITFWENSATATVAGQGAGSSTGSSCPSLITVGDLLSTVYTHNRYENPLLGAGIYPSNIFRPGGGSPVFTGAVLIPNKSFANNGFFENVCFRGAIGPNAADDWTAGWTYYDSTGAGRFDLHLPTMPDPRPLAIYHNINLTGCCNFWGPDSNYEVRGQLRIKNGGHLAVAPGVVIFEDVATVGTIIVERGGALTAVGNKCEPIIVTSNAAPGTQRRGDIGGLALLGRAPTNVVNSCAGDSAASEGGAIGFYGGADSTDCSGALRYVRVEYAGKEITPNNELNAFTWNACGLRTRGDYLQAFRGADDGFEWFGGRMDQKYLLAVDGTDDGYDTQLGTRNRSQFVIVRVTSEVAPSGGQNGDRGIEADNNEFNQDQVQCSGRANTILANATFIGDRRFGPAFPGSTSGTNIRRGTGFTIVNSIFTNFKNSAIAVNDVATWNAHCSKLPPVVPNPNPGCTTTSVAPITGGNVFVTRGLPNPFRNTVNITFALPQAGPVTVEVFAADGRRVQTIADGVMEAGQHTIPWTLGKNTPTGVYFYQVVAGNQKSTGKITHLD